MIGFGFDSVMYVGLVSVWYVFKWDCDFFKVL